MSPQEWLKILKIAYLQGFIRRGGSSVKFVVVEEAEDTKAVVSGVGTLAREEGFVTIEADSRQTKVQLIDLLFQGRFSGVSIYVQFQIPICRSKIPGASRTYLSFL